MDKQKKQIILAAVLGVLALGMGSYFVLTRERVDPNRGRVAATGPLERKARKDTTTDKPDRKKRATKRTAQDEPKVMARRTRERTEQKASKRGSARRGSVEKIRKKETKPAA